MQNKSAAARQLQLGLLVMATVTGVIGSLGAPMVPAIAVEEGVSLGAAQWSLTLTLLVGAVATPLIGALGTGARRRPVLLVTLVLVFVGCLLSALPLGFEALLVGRALQGLGFGINPLALAVARDALPQSQQRNAMSMISVMTVVSAGLGFPVAAVLADLVGVKGAFGVAAAVTAATVVLAIRTVPGSESTETRAVDWTGALLLGSGTLGVLLGITQVPVHGIGSTGVLVPAAIGAALLAVSVLWLLRARVPLVDVRLALSPGVIGANIAALLAGTGMYLMMVTVMVLVQTDPAAGEGFGLSVTVAGVMMTPYAVASVVGARLSLRLVKWISPDLLLPIGCFGFGMANLLLVVAHDHVWQILLVMTVGGLGSGLTFNSIPWLMARVVPVAQTGSAIGFNVVLRFLGFAIGSALSTAVILQMSSGMGHPAERGYVASALVGFGVSLVAGVLCLILARSAKQALPTPANLH